MTKANLLVFLNSLKIDSKLDKDALIKLRDSVYSLLLKQGELVPKEILYLASSFMQANLDEKKELSVYINTANSHLSSLNDNEKEILALLKAVCQMLNSDKNAILDYAKIVLSLKKQNEFLNNIIKNFNNDEYLSFATALFDKNFIFLLEEKEQKALILNFPKKENKKLYTIFLKLLDEYTKNKNLEMFLFLWQALNLQNFCKKVDYGILEQHKAKRPNSNKKHKKLRIGFVKANLNDTDSFIYEYSALKTILLNKELLNTCEFYFYDCTNGITNEPNGVFIVDLIQLGIYYKAPAVKDINDKYNLCLLECFDKICKNILKDEIDILINLSTQDLFVNYIFMQNLAKKQSEILDISKLEIPLDAEKFLNKKLANGIVEVTRELYNKKAFILGSINQNLTKDDLELICHILDENKNAIFICVGKQKITKKHKNMIFAGNVDENVYSQIIDLWIGKTLDLNAKMFLLRKKAGLFYEKSELKSAYIGKDEISAKILEFISNKEKFKTFKNKLLKELADMQKTNFNKFTQYFKNLIFNK